MGAVREPTAHERLLAALQRLSPVAPATLRFRWISHFGSIAITAQVGYNGEVVQVANLASDCGGPKRLFVEDQPWEARYDIFYGTVFHDT